MYANRLFKILNYNFFSNISLPVRTFASENPIYKSLGVIKNDISGFLSSKKGSMYPKHVDVVVIGGGFIGSAIAYSLKLRTGDGLSVLILEKDFDYQNMLYNNTLATLTQHFSLPENIQLSKYSANFLRNIKEHLGSDIDIQFRPCRNLLLASEKYADKMIENVTLLKEHGIKYELISTEDIKSSFPWLSTHDIKLGCIGYDTEGTFNAGALLMGLIKKAQELGATLVNAEVVGFELEKQRDVLMEGVTPGTFERLNKVIYKTPDNEQHEVEFAACILAAGDESQQVAKLAKIGYGDGILTVPLPVEKRSCEIYSIAGKGKSSGLNMPAIIDTSGLWLRRNGIEDNLLFGHVPFISNENLPTDQYFSSVIKPSLLNRYPTLEDTDIKQIATEKQDCNTYDYTGILGPHAYHNNLYIAAGFGKQGCLHAPGIGRAVAELIIDSYFTTIDLTRFGFDRFLTNQPLVDFNIY